MDSQSPKSSLIVKVQASLNSTSHAVPYSPYALNAEVFHSHLNVAQCCKVLNLTIALFPLGDARALNNETKTPPGHFLILDVSLTDASLSTHLASFPSS